MRGNRKGPLFLFTDGRSLTHEQFSSALNNLLKQLKIDSRWYNTHSFHIGATTSARQANIPDKYIKILGRWKSDAYLSYYIKTPPQSWLNYLNAYHQVTLTLHPAFKKRNI